MIETLRYVYSNNLAIPPGTGQVRFDATDPLAVTRLRCHYQTDDGIDAFYGLLAIPVATVIYVQDRNNHAQYARFTLTADPVDQTGYIEFTVAGAMAGGAALSNSQAVLVAFVTEAAVGGLPAPGASLVTLTEAKHVARITHDEEDDVVTLALDAAEAAILRYLDDSPFLPELPWTLATVPRDVKAAILRAFVDWFYNRGDSDPTGTPDWPPATIRGLLARWKDPGLA
jgi:Phage gp6-like head-tail connector protein